ncbi:hypothetical protein LPJ61_002683 [Coemansia biformis]|uniref:Up-regulated during septation protein 1 domain-containing protein n=1 Tax=Coemansia biformis TaxID=1286918 RepID=A0A9W7Y7X4_9FUNG|nr:hypothetical protein LPJ61_002683 [Coemansia biformis]
MAPSSLSGRLLHMLDVSSSETALDGVLAAAAGGHGSTGSNGRDPRLAEAAALLVGTVVSTSDVGPVLSPLEYDKHLCEAAALRSRLHSLRTQLAMDVHARDLAKTHADTQKTGSIGMFKGKHSHHVQVDEYNAACAAVKHTEDEIATLSAELHASEAALHGHQLAVLLSAVKTAVSEAACSELAGLEREADRTRAALAAELDDNAARHAMVKKALEERVRELENRSHDTIARQAAWSIEGASGGESLADHSARLDTERMSGELTVLREQKQEAEVQARVLETKLDEALLRAREAQASLDDSRRLAADLAQAASARLESAQADAGAHAQCVQAVSSGLRALVAPLRALNTVCDSHEKLRAANDSSVAIASTPPDTPPPTAPRTLPSGAMAAAALESLLDCSQGDRAHGSRGGGMDGLGAEQVATALSLVASTLDSCSLFHAEAMKMHGGYVQTQKDLGTEKRLREAQGLAISQQRERLAAANRLAEGADQRVKEATDALAAQHAENRLQWDEERQRLLDNTERLMRDARGLKARIAPGPVAVGSIEHVVSSPVDLQARIGDVTAQLESSQADADAARRQLQALADENGRLRRAESSLQEQLAGLESFGAMHGALGREPGAPKRKARAHPGGPAGRAASFGDHRNGEQGDTAVGAMPLLGGSTGHGDVAAVGRSDAQTMTDAGPSPSLADDGIGPMLAAYSEKLMLKEDALRSREDDLESVRAAAMAIEQALHDTLAATSGSGPASLGHGPRARHHAPGYVLGDARPATVGVAGRRASANGRAAIGDTPDRVRGLIPLVETAAAESRHLRELAARLESHAQIANAELHEARQRVAQLQEHCRLRAGQDDAIQQDIAHVLGQISRLRNRIVQLEGEKATFEAEVVALRQRCREMESQNAEQVMQLIVERVGKRDWEKHRCASTVAGGPAAALDSGTAAAPAATAAEASSTASTDPKMLSRFSSFGTVSISHPEASDIRAEFNELMHQLIARRDEDIDRVQALADAWRADAHRALRANELRAWCTGTRGTQTISDH